jgi:hypothetical protein
MYAVLDEETDFSCIVYCSEHGCIPAVQTSFMDSLTRSLYSDYLPEPSRVTSGGITHNQKNKLSLSVTTQQFFEKITLSSLYATCFGCSAIIRQTIVVTQI